MTGTFVLRQRDVVFKNLYSVPVRKPGENTAYGFRVQSSNMFTDTASGYRSYLAYFSATRLATYPYAEAAGKDDAVVRITGSNYAANAAVYNWRSLNVDLRNRSGGTVGIMENLISTNNSSGATVSSQFRGLFVSAENYGTLTDGDAVALEVVLRQESTGGAPTTSALLRLRNDDRSGAPAVDSGIDIDTHASSGGLTQLIDASDATLVEYDSGTKVILMKFKTAAGADAWLVHDTDSATSVSVTGTQPT